MKIYVLLTQSFDWNKTVCVSEDVNKIRKSICEELDAMNDYPVLEIWENGKQIDCVVGNNVLKKVANEINTI